MIAQTICLALLSTVFVQASDFQKENSSIIIIGAGPSGIAAASKLWGLGVRNFQILEAENRTGGRVNSVKFGDAYVDLGAEWCHGQGGNIVYSLIKDLNIVKHINLSQRFLTSNSEYLDDELSHDIMQVAKDVDASDMNPEYAKNCRNVSSTGECVRVNFDWALAQKYKQDEEKSQIIQGSIDWLQSYMNGYDASFNWDDLYINSTYKRCEGDLYLSWNGHGYRTILEVLLKKIPDPSQAIPIDDRLHLNTEVVKISDWDKDDIRTKVETKDGRTFEADYVLFTPSAGVLKHSHETLFEPSLPSDKIEGIEAVGFGAILKIIARFSEDWWAPNEAWYYIWTKEGRERMRRSCSSCVTKWSSTQNGTLQRLLCRDMEGRRTCVDMRELANFVSRHFDLDVPFGRFPTNPAIKKRWLDALGLDPEDVPIYSLLCSTHFAKGDFVVAGTRTFLSSKAIPFLPSIRFFIHDPETDPVASAKGETISATRCSSETLAAPEICEFNQESDMPIITTNDKQDSETLSLVSFSMTLTASSPALSESPQKSPVQTPDLENIYTEHQYCINLQLQKRKRTPDVDTVKKKIECLPSKTNVLHPRQPRQPAKQFQSVSDFKREDIEDPIKRDQYFTLINEAVKSQQTKIRCLQTKNRRMRNKLSSLRALTSHLKQKNLISEIAETTLNSGKLWLTNLAGWEPQENNPKVLTGWFAGDAIPEIEQLSENEIIEAVDYALQTFFGKLYNVTKPVEVIRTTWYSNPHFRGTYSHESTQGCKKLQNIPDILAKPLKGSNGNPSIFFAGEATHPYYFSTVHGAIETGYREAENIFKIVGSSENEA